MFFIILSIILGLIAGIFLPIPTDQAMSLYFSVAIFAALDSVIGAFRSMLLKKFDSLIFISGFVFNTIVAMILAYVGDRLGLPLYYAAVFVFGTRLFSNFAIIRRFYIDYLKSKYNKNNSTFSYKHGKRYSKKIYYYCKQKKSSNIKY